jgi:hypothetical protein
MANGVVYAAHMNWLRVGYALREVTTVLAGVVEKEAVAFHDSLLKKMTGMTKFKAKRSLFATEPGSVIGNKAKRNQCVKSYGLGVLSPWVNEIMGHHVLPVKSRKVHWQNSDASKWCHKGGHWEVMKLFCSHLGRHSYCILKQQNAAAADLACLISMMLHCKVSGVLRAFLWHYYLIGDSSRYSTIGPDRY